MTALPPRRAKRIQVETQIVLPAIRAALAAMPDVKIHRNVNARAYFLPGGIRGRKLIPAHELRLATVGFGDGSADLIGSLLVCVQYTYTRAGKMPGGGAGVRSIARSFAIEVKREEGIRAEPEQIAWLESHRAAGWIVGVCGSVEDAVALIERARRWEL